MSQGFDSGGRPRSRIVFLCLRMAAVLLLASCGTAQAMLPPTSTQGATATPDPLTEASPTATATALPTRTPTPSATPMPTETSTPTVTPTPMHPMDVRSMRQQRYPGSEIVIEETLAPGSNYDRYVVSYQSEGLTIFGLLTVPRGERPESGWPVIVLNHGYIPPDQYRTTERYVAYQDAFARNGYITLKPDYRGHGDSEGNPSGGSRGPEYTIDVLNAAASLRRYPDADPERMGMWGHSMGGGIILRAMVVVDHIKAGVIWAGTVATYEETFAARPRWVGGRPTSTPGPNGTPPAQPVREGLFAYGTFDENPEFWAAIDPVSYLSDLSGPLQIHHATGDQSVPVGFSEDFYIRLQAAGRAAELYIYEGDNHNLSANFGTAAQRSVAFFDQHVKGVSGE
jgi:uncharacterized protein